METLTKGTVIECIASTDDRDTAGESLDANGADISPLVEGRGFVNSDHRSDFAHLVGKVHEAKIIKSLADCATPAQIKYWNEVKKPFIWTKAEIWDGHGHKEADSIASIYRFYQARGEEAPVKVSVEGKTLERGPNGLLKKTLIKGIALTVAPCNRKTRTEVVQITKSAGVDPDRLMKSDGYVPSFIEIQEGDHFQKLYQLAVTARELLRDARVGLGKAEKGSFRPQSRKSLERLKQLTASLKKDA